MRQAASPQFRVYHICSVKIQSTAGNELHSLSEVAPLVPVVEVLDESIQRLDERVQAGALRPHETVTVNLPLAIPWKLSSRTDAGRVQHTADVGVVLHPVAVVFRPAAHVGVVLTRVLDQAFHRRGCGG